MILRPMTMRDAKNFCRWLRDEEVTKLLLDDNTKPPPSVRSEKKYIIEKNKDAASAQFSINTLDGVHIGAVGLNKIDYQNRKAVFGIFIGDKKYWGQGMGTEASHLILDFGFRKLKLHRIYLQVFAFNIRAIKSYRMLGFAKEGTMRNSLYRDGLFHDEIAMGILRYEFYRKFKK